MVVPFSNVVTNPVTSSQSAVERADGRSVRAGSERTEQLNVSVLPALKERLKRHCQRRGIKITDWMEETLLGLED